MNGQIAGEFWASSGSTYTAATTVQLGGQNVLGEIAISRFYFNGQAAGWEFCEVGFSQIVSAAGTQNFGPEPLPHTFWATGVTSVTVTASVYDAFVEARWMFNFW